MKYPAYPLITIDPFCTIWSSGEKLNENETILWTGLKRSLRGIVKIDGIPYRFLGKGDEKIIPQTSVEVTPYITKYTFENEQIYLYVNFMTPQFVHNTELLSTPCSYIEVNAVYKNKMRHSYSVSIHVDKEFCYDKNAKPVYLSSNKFYSRMCLCNQKPLNKSGDVCGADWGEYYIVGDKNGKDENGIFSESNSEATFFLFGFDDIYSMEYKGDKYKALWTEKFENIIFALEYYKKEKERFFALAEEKNPEILSGAERFGKNYISLLSVAFRQVLAGHKLFKDDCGNVLYFSKECNSNGCVNTVDVSYPAIPIFLIHNPEIVKAYMMGILDFALSPGWSNDFAPHDIGRYPLANGQVYGLLNSHKIYKQKLFYKKGRHFKFKQQMPVEECGNMLIMAYTYMLKSGDTSFFSSYKNLFKKWADYLVSVGVDLENQLCTDDFAGHSKRNVNLAIKSIMGIKCYACMLGADGDEYAEKAKEFADELSLYILPDGTLPFALGVNTSWSMKYNLVWDKLLGFNLFDGGLYKAEAELYKNKMNRYGTPLDYRKDFTKTDWLMWASVLDDSDELTTMSATALSRLLDETTETFCFSDWTETKEAKHIHFNHRTVQGGLWMPLLKF